MPRKSERTRQRIVEAANQLFYYKGYNRTSFSDVVAAAGVPRGNIYYYFKSKDDILKAAIDYRIDRIGGMLQGWTESYRTPIERIKRFLGILPGSVDSLRQYGCPMGSLNTELGKEQRELQSKARALFILFEDWLADELAELGYAGRARELARRLIAWGQGVSVLTHVHGDAEFLHREVRAMEDLIDKLAAGEDVCLTT
jgi:AcrR family transcriptional regulator